MGVGKLGRMLRLLRFRAASFFWGRPETMAQNLVESPLLEEIFGKRVLTVKLHRPEDPLDVWFLEVQPDRSAYPEGEDHVQWWRRRLWHQTLQRDKIPTLKEELTFPEAPREIIESIEALKALEEAMCRQVQEELVSIRRSLQHLGEIYGITLEIRAFPSASQGFPPSQQKSRRATILGEMESS